jgi:hypothetical protein
MYAAMTQSNGDVLSVARLPEATSRSAPEGRPSDRSAAPAELTIAGLQEQQPSSAA